MTHAVSLLYWLSAGIYDVSTTTQLSDLLVSISTVMFSRQVSGLSNRWALSLAHYS